MKFKSNNSKLITLYMLVWEHQNKVQVTAETETAPSRQSTSIKQLMTHLSSLHTKITW